MKKPILLAASLATATLLILALPGVCHAQAAKAQPARATPEKPESTEPPAAPPRRSRRHLDARECLKYPTNMEIHGCALKYL
jgi:hypothetical protein